MSLVEASEILRAVTRHPYFPLSIICSPLSHQHSFPFARPSSILGIPFTANQFHHIQHGTVLTSTLSPTAVYTREILFNLSHAYAHIHSRIHTDAHIQTYSRTYKRSPIHILKHTHIYITLAAVLQSNSTLYNLLLSPLATHLFLSFSFSFTIFNNL